jgi:hypothetical protein
MWYNYIVMKRSRTQYLRDRYERSRREGRCVSCGRPNDMPNGVTCSTCRAKYTARYNARGAAGLCAACEQAAQPGRKFCAPCQERDSARQRDRGRRVRQEALEHYGNNCACCGETRTEFLAIDHIEGGGNEHRRKLNTKGGTSFYHKLRKLGWPGGLRVLCHNCNASLGHYGYCPHQDRASASVR